MNADFQISQDNALLDLSKIQRQELINVNVNDTIDNPMVVPPELQRLMRSVVTLKLGESFVQYFERVGSLICMPP
eukprot:Awhi_evm1s12473